MRTHSEETSKPSDTIQNVLPEITERYRKIKKKNLRSNCRNPQSPQLCKLYRRLRMKIYANSRSPVPLMTRPVCDRTTLLISYPGGHYFFYLFSICLSCRRRFRPSFSISSRGSQLLLEDLQTFPSQPWCNPYIGSCISVLSILSVSVRLHGRR